jgi:hypothetical protein
MNMAERVKRNQVNRNDKTCVGLTLGICESEQHRNRESDGRFPLHIYACVYIMKTVKAVLRMSPLSFPIV